MKKISIAFVFVLIVHLCFGVTAFPELIEFKQPDGTKISIYLFGDEKVHWAETVDGYTLLFNSRGFLEYAIADNNGNLQSSGLVARDVNKRSATDLFLLSSTPKHLRFSQEQINTMLQIWETSAKNQNNLRDFPTTGERKLICILIGFQDVPFTLGQSDFQALFNQIGYTYDNATGSVKDYYLEVSYNQFNLTVDIAGPYQASQNRVFYGGDSGDPRQLTLEAINFADNDVNFAQYDNDNDGWVDGVYIIFAGHGEEAGAPSEAIWSHAWSLSSPVQKDGVWLQRYSCSPEFRGNSGTNITRIGVICHEFGHVLGAPDFYDTNYNNYGDGQFEGTGKWDMMAGGSWNNSGATPAHHNAFTKTVVYGWGQINWLNAPQSVEMSPSTLVNTSFLAYNTKTTGEYFLLEYREKIGFDNAIPGSGLIIYHVHKLVLSSGNSINVTHPQKMYPVAQNATSEPNTNPSSYGNINSSTCAWTGLNGTKTSFTDNSIPSSKSWAGQNTERPLTNIHYNSTTKKVTFDFMGGMSCNAPTAGPQSFEFSQQQDEVLNITCNKSQNDGLLILASKNRISAIPINGTVYNASYVFGQGQEIEPNVFVVYSGTGNSLTLSQLLPATKYHFAAFEYNSQEYCYNYIPLFDSIITTGTPLCTPCQASALADDDRGIVNVSFNTINNTSSTAPSYSDFRNIFTEVHRGQTYNLSVKVNTNGNNTMFTRVWIDWNANCIFELSETYDLGTTTNQSEGLTSLSPLPITIPQDASLGRVTMRIRTRSGQDAKACNANNYSEAEDYILKILEATGFCNISNNSIAVYPNPSDDFINVTIDNLQANSSFEIINYIGITVRRGQITTQQTSINVAGLKSGIYTLKIGNQQSNYIAKFIKK